jgi:hypothetical protein
MWHQTDLPQAAQHREQLDASTRAVAELAGELSSVRNGLLRLNKRGLLFWRVSLRRDCRKIRTKPN